MACIDGDEIWVELLSNMTAKDLDNNSPFPSRTLVLIEKAQARPGQGVSSMFNYGTGFGRLMGWCEALGLPYELVTPQAWGKVMHAGTTGTDPKARSLQAVQRLFPGVQLTVGKSKKVHMGLAEALLIAEYGVRRAGWSRRKTARACAQGPRIRLETAGARQTRSYERIKPSSDMDRIAVYGPNKTYYFELDDVG